jgi:hypothetical protein
MEYHGVHVIDEEFLAMMEVVKGLDRPEENLFTITDLNTWVYLKKLCEFYGIEFPAMTTMKNLLSHARRVFHDLYVMSKLVDSKLPTSSFHVELHDEKPDVYWRGKVDSMTVTNIVYNRGFDQVTLHPIDGRKKTDNTESSVITLPTVDHVKNVKRKLKFTSFGITGKYFFNNRTKRLIQHVFPYCINGTHRHPSENTPFNGINRFGNDSYTPEEVETLMIQHLLLELRAFKDLNGLPVYFEVKDGHVVTLWLHVVKKSDRDALDVDLSRFPNLESFNPGHGWKTLEKLTG